MPCHPLADGRQPPAAGWRSVELKGAMEARFSGYACPRQHSVLANRPRPQFGANVDQFIDVGNQAHPMLSRARPFATRASSPIAHNSPGRTVCALLTRAWLKYPLLPARPSSMRVGGRGGAGRASGQRGRVGQSPSPGWARAVGATFSPPGRATSEKPTNRAKIATSATRRPGTESPDASRASGAIQP